MRDEVLVFLAEKLRDLARALEAAQEIVQMMEKLAAAARLVPRGDVKVTGFWPWPEGVRSGELAPQGDERACTSTS